MKKLDHRDRPDNVEEVVENCLAYWVLSGLPRRRVEEMKLELEQHLREALADGKTIEAVVGTDVNAFAAAWVREERVSKSVGEHVLDWSYLLLLAAAVVLPWQHLVLWTPAFPVYWGTLAVVGLIALGTKVLLKPGVLTGALFRGPRRWRKILMIAAVWVGVTAVFVFLQIFSSRSAVLFYWPWPATVVLLAVTGIVVWIALRGDPTRLLPPDEEVRANTPEAARSIAEKCWRVWVKVGPHILVWGVAANLYLTGASVREGPSIETSIEILLLLLLFWMVVIPANLIWAEDDMFRQLAWGVLPFAYWSVLFHLAGVLPPGDKELLLKTLMVLLVLLLALGAYRFYRKRWRFLFWFYLVMAVLYAATLSIRWSDFAPFW